MNSRVSKGQWIRLAGSMLTVAGVFGAWIGWSPLVTNDSALEKLQVEYAGLHGSDDGSLNSLVTERAAIARTLPSVDMAELQDRFGPLWTWKPVAGDLWMISLDATRREGWAEILVRLDELERQPGLLIESMELHGNGRAFTSGRVLIRVRPQNVETETGLVPRPATVSGQVKAAPGPGSRARSVAAPSTEAASATAFPAARPAPASFRPGSRDRRL